MRTAVLILTQLFGGAAVFFFTYAIAGVGLACCESGGLQLPFWFAVLVGSAAGTIAVALVVYALGYASGGALHFTVLGGVLGIVTVYAVAYGVGGKPWIVYDSSIVFNGLAGVALVPPGAVIGNLLSGERRVQASGSDLERPTSRV